MGNLTIDAFLELAKQKEGFIHNTTPGTLLVLPAGYLYAICIAEAKGYCEGLRWSFTSAEAIPQENKLILDTLNLLVKDFDGDAVCTALKDALEAH